MGGVNRERAGIEVEREEAERLSADDRATMLADLHTESALEAFRARRAREQQHERPGVCTNCSATCLPTAVYCDAECREDHERVLRARSRTGAAPR